ncbi:5965_t:CDS:2 [Acaulospora colombiana]|uniref:5965_t:CDS:1 n=1 Tax=Acaulospora colombiana TaxID=27376 RepID=A0ACA9NN92_9GLOM|nr:5965_t:CDS:2 [Acaulospora colombiana]
MSNHPHEDDDTMIMDDEGDMDGEDQLVDDEGSPSVAPPLSHTSSNNQTTRDTSPPDHKPASSARRRRPHEGSSSLHGPIDKSARKREQREREKEQQKQLLAKLIEIFGERFKPHRALTLSLAEAGGGTCAVQQGQKKFPWVDLPAALIRIGKYFAGWPEKCLPKMSDKHPDRIDASTGPSQWSLKQKRAMEAQIAKGANFVLLTCGTLASYRQSSDIRNCRRLWKRQGFHCRVLGKLGPLQTIGARDLSPPNRTLALPPIRAHGDSFNERLDLPSLSKMTSYSGLHTPEDGSRSPSPSSNFSDSRHYPGSFLSSNRQTHCPPLRNSYPSSLSQDDFFSSRGRVLTLEHGLPRTATSLRSTSRQRSIHPYHHHPYSQTLAASSMSSIRSRPPSPLSVHTHSHSRSHSGVTTSTLPAANELLPGSASRSASLNGPSLSPSSGAGQQSVPSHVPDVPGSVVAWDAPTRGWVLKVQHEGGLRTLPCSSGSLVLWHREMDEWECRPAQPEIGRAIWNRGIGRWELYLPSDDDMDVSAAPANSSRHANYPTHIPAVDGTCLFDSERFHAWVFYPAPGCENQLPITPCVIVWSVERKQWSLLSESPNGAEVSWSQEDKAWHFSMQMRPSSKHGNLGPSSNASPRPSSAPHPNTLPPLIMRASSPIHSPRSTAARPMSTASSSF